MKKILPISLVIMLLVMKLPAFPAERKSTLFVYNSSYDLMRGDLWNYIKDQQILLDLETYPKNFVVIGKREGISIKPSRIESRPRG